MNTICEIEPNYVLTKNEKSELHTSLSSILIDPYRQYEAFCYQVIELLKEKKIPTNLVKSVRHYSAQDVKEEPFIFIKNLPVDENVPPFDNVNPVISKYDLKKTFVAEGCLYLMAYLLDQTPIGYLNVNKGDVFQDIYPQKKLKDSQSQKALGPIYFHKDLANHYVRPDYVNMISMRSHVENEIYTTFVKNKDVIAELSEEQIAKYREPRFYTPFDDLTTKTGSYEVGDANIHPIISGDFDIRFFENRTVGVDEEAKILVEQITQKMHELKQCVQMIQGDFIGVANNYAVHGKEIGKVKNPDSAWSRWTVKTVNVNSIEPYREYLVAGSQYLIQG